VSRVTKKSCKLCRREGEKLFLKGDRCLTAKCSYSKRSYAPGPHGKRPKKFSEYGLRLREKQKARRIYGLNERQFKNYFGLASRRPGITGENLLIMLEKRLDNVIYRLGLAASRAQARELVGHGHFLVNGRTRNVASSRVKVKDQIVVKEKSRGALKSAAEIAKDKQLPPWLTFDPAAWAGSVVSEVTRTMIDTPIDDRLIVEHYSR
jgi:small subunit ribosomal protein S4